MRPEPDGTDHWHPNFNVFITTDGHLIVKVDLCELRSDDLEVTVEKNIIMVKGVRRDDERLRARKYLVDRIPAGPFESRAEIPEEFDLSAAKANYQNGDLRIIVPPKALPNDFRGSPFRY